MNLKFGAPIAGILGTFASSFGLVSGGGVDSTLNSGSPSNQLVVKNLSDSWKIKVVEPVEISYICNGEGSSAGKISGTFSVTVDSGTFNGKETKLIKRERVDVRISYGFNVANAQESLRGLGGKKEAWMTVSNDWDGGLRIALKEVNMKAMRISDVNLRCKIKTENGMSELQEYKNSNEIFSGKIEVDGNGGTVALKDWKGSLRASLYNCQPKVSEGDNATCDLKLTDSSNWQWSIKASKQAKLESSSVKL